MPKLTASLSVAIAIVCILAATSVTAQDPLPDELFNVSPIPVTPGQVPPILPTCPPLVISKGAAFVCYMDSNGTNVAQFVSPASPGQFFTASRVTSYAGEPFRQQPIALSQLTAIVSVSNEQNSMWAMLSSMQVLHEHDRRGSTADVAYSSDLQTLFVPLGQAPRVGPQDSLNAVDVTSAEDVILWNQKFLLPDGFSGATAMQTPIYYRGFLYVIQANTFYKLNATKAPNGANQVIWNISNPCGIFPATGYMIQMRVVTVGADVNGPLDAFILYANTSTTGTGSMMICRVSHFDGRAKWPSAATTYPMDLDVHDVSGGSNVIFVSARLTGSHNYDASFMILVVSADLGSHMYTINRRSIDRLAFPLPLQNPTLGCTSSFVVQVKGNLTAFCTLDGKVSWTSPYQCNERAVSVVASADEAVACSSLQQSVQLINVNDGSLIWRVPLAVVFPPSFVDSVIWAIDIDGGLHGFSVAAAPPSPTTMSPQSPEARKGLTAGEVVLIVFAFAFAIGLGGGIAFSWVRRTKRRGPYQATLDQDGYGSLS